MALDEKTAPFAYHSVIHIKVVPANTNRGHIRYVLVISQFHRNKDDDDNNNNNNNNNKCNCLLVDVITVYLDVNEYKVKAQNF